MAALCRDWRVIKPVPSDKLSDRTAKDILDSNDSRHEVYGCQQHENAAS